MISRKPERGNAGIVPRPWCTVKLIQVIGRILGALSPSFLKLSIHFCRYREGCCIRLPTFSRHSDVRFAGPTDFSHNAAGDLLEDISEGSTATKRRLKCCEKGDTGNPHRRLKSA